jgi:hypothetical protein
MRNVAQPRGKPQLCRLARFCRLGDMRSITLSQLRDTRLWLPWLKAGETIELRERKTVIAHIIPNKRFVKEAAAGRRPPKSKA